MKRISYKTCINTNKYYIYKLQYKENVEKRNAGHRPSQNYYTFSKQTKKWGVMKKMQIVYEMLFLFSSKIKTKYFI